MPQLLKVCFVTAVGACAVLVCIGGRANGQKKDRPNGVVVVKDRFICDIAVSNDGKLLAVAGRGGISLYDVESGKKMRLLPSEKIARFEQETTEATEPKTKNFSLCFLRVLLLNSSPRLTGAAN